MIFKLQPKGRTEPQPQREKVASVCVIARHPGASAYFQPLITDFLTAGVEVTSIVTEQAAQSLNQFAQLNNLELIPLTQTPVVEWALISGDNPPNFEVESLLQLKVANKDLRIGVAEDSPGSITKMLEALAQANLLPALVATTTRDQATTYRELIGRLQPSKTLPTIIPIGQPTFDNLTQVYSELRSPTRDKLVKLSKLETSDTSNLKIITFVGVPEGDFPAIEVPSNAGHQHQDLNSTTLAMALDSVAAQAHQNPQLQYLFIYKPHPRSKEMQRHPYLAAFTSTAQEQKQTNIHLAYYDNDSLKDQGLTTQALCAASDLVINTLSTIGQELGVVKAQTQDIDSPSSVLILPTDYFEAYKANKEKFEADEKLSKTILELYAGAMRLKKAGAATVIQAADQSEAVFNQILLNQEGTPTSVDAYDTLRNQYRLKSPATPKMLRWMRATQNPRTRSTPRYRAGL